MILRSVSYKSKISIVFQGSESDREKELERQLEEMGKGEFSLDKPSYFKNFSYGYH